MAQPAGSRCEPAPGAHCSASPATEREQCPRGRRCHHGGDVGLAMPKDRDFDEDVVQGSLTLASRAGAP
jgi:hypothetical protein